MTKRMRHCCYCSDEIGEYEDRHYDKMDTCGKQECNRAVAEMMAEEREEAHDRLDRDMGY